MPGTVHAQFICLESGDNLYLGLQYVGLACVIIFLPAVNFDCPYLPVRV